MSATFPVLNPATEEIIEHVPNATSQEWNQALDAVVAAGSQWAALNARQRSNVLLALSEALETQVEEYAELIHREMAKPLAEARAEALSAVDTLRWYSEEAVRLPGRYAEAPNGGAHFIITRRPIGPVLAITPWNFPLSLGVRKIAPALAAGCPVLIKPAQETPLTMIRFGELLREVCGDQGLELCPVTVVSTTHDAELSQELMNDPRLAKVSFTGSTNVGKILVKQSGERLLRTSMELGGNAPLVIHQDADLDKAVQGAFLLKTRNGGQVCVAANRILVHEAIAEAFTEKLVDLMSAAPACALITEAQRNRVADLVNQAVAAGAELHCGGNIPEGPGYFYPTTVLSDVPETSSILHEEIFGPVAVIQTFSTLDEGVAMANDSEFGLAAYGYSENLRNAQFLADNLNAGMIAINGAVVFDNATPFGGIKQSGFGREGGFEGIEEYLDTRLARWQQ
ncbi:aldehyde dehydrogenase family protein [Corynebacterium sp. 3HC-13]|uniref:aldehyde dehydrogenase family protein n=1 Tax=Corynebacterium poyangense TaxID=2684405 RepID=UPI001CCFC223|nr:aldehyde dehydrogenase family protein [Corynebacterium poyangense]MBZ8177355.1 aldehyde dehydrogenase family protein [Corynebacterium poyangense]